MTEQLDLYTDERSYDKLCEIDKECGDDNETKHGHADTLLEEVLRNLGFNKAMDKLDEMEKDFRYA